MAFNQQVNVYGQVPPSYYNEGPVSKKTEVYGLNFPLGSDVEKGGYFKKISGVKMVRAAIRQLLLTERGERVMLPEFGCNLRKFLFSPLDENTFTAIKDEIRTSFQRYIVGASIVKLAVFPTGDTGPSGGNSLQIILTIKLDTEQTQVFDVEAKIG